MGPDSFRLERGMRGKSFSRDGRGENRLPRGTEEQQIETQAETGAGLWTTPKFGLGREYIFPVCVTFHLITLLLLRKERVFFFLLLFCPLCFFFFFFLRKGELLAEAFLGTPWLTPVAPRGQCSGVLPHPNRFLSVCVADKVGTVPPPPLVIECGPL